jgi:hypothetical protein
MSGRHTSDQQTPAPGFGGKVFSLVGSIWLHPPRRGWKAQGFKEGSSLHRSCARNLPPGCSWARWCAHSCLRMTRLNTAPGQPVKGGAFELRVQPGRGARLTQSLRCQALNAVAHPTLRHSPVHRARGILRGMQQVVIYAFRSPGSGSVYIGKHECDPTGWPRRGNGRLPDGYTGSGNVVPRFHRRHGAAVEWRILAVVADADWPRAERRAVHLARLIFGRRCVNIRSGGEGFTSAEARSLNADPLVKAKHSASMRQSHARPEVKARRSAASRESQNRPEVKAKQSATNARPEVKARRSAAAKEANARPDVKAKQRASQSTSWSGVLARAAALSPEALARRSATHKALARTPERQAHLARANQIRWRRARARKALAPFAVPPSIVAPGVCLWAYLPTLGLSIAGPTAAARRR